MLAFLLGIDGAMVRRYTFASYHNRGRLIDIVTDASPWGLSGILYVGGAPISYFSSAITSDDVNILRQKIGDPNGQQMWESLAILVSLRLWQHQWKDTRVQLRVKGDSVTGLTLLLHQTSGRATLSVVAREIALEFAEGSFRPTLLEHIPGVSNITADMLSRKHDPNKEYQFPDELQRATEVTAPMRVRAWYRALDPPDAEMIAAATLADAAHQAAKTPAASHTGQLGAVKDEDQGYQ